MDLCFIVLYFIRLLALALLDYTQRLVARQM